MASQRPGPFTDVDLIEINQRLEDLNEVDRIIDQSKRAGIDMREQETKAREARQQLLRFKQGFFPGR